jgi:hypothetical protein
MKNTNPNSFNKTNGILNFGNRTVKVVAVFSLVIVFGVASTSFGFTSVPGRVLAKPKSTTQETAVQNAFKAAGAKEIGRLQQINVRILQVPAKAEAKVITALAKNPNFEFVEPD